MKKNQMFEKFKEFGIENMDPNYLADLILDECLMEAVEFAELVDIEPAGEDEDVVIFKDTDGKNWEVVYDWA